MAIQKEITMKTGEVANYWQLKSVNADIPRKRISVIYGLFKDSISASSWDNSIKTIIKVYDNEQVDEASESLIMDYDSFVSGYTGSSSSNIFSHVESKMLTEYKPFLGGVQVEDSL